MDLRPWRIVAIGGLGITLGLLWNGLSGRGFALGQSVFVQRGDEVIEAPEAKARLRHRALQLSLRLLLGGLFVYASLDKIANPPAFARIVYQWQVLGPVPSNLVAVILPWLEALAGVLLLAGIWRREAALVVALLLVV